MVDKIKRSLLKAKRGIYITILLLLGSMSFPFFYGCNQRDREAEKKRIDDSIAAERKAEEEILAFKMDSTEAANGQKEINDSIKRADSVAKAKQQYYNNRIQPEYGVVRPVEWFDKG